MIWSLVLLLALLGLTRGWRRLGPILRSGRSLALLSTAALVLSVNWTTYVYAVSTDQVVESSLGYFINPLVSVALGVLVLRERLRRWQWAAVALAAVGVVVIGIAGGALPWIGLILAFSFGIYGLLKKLAGADAVPSLTVETAVLAPVAVTLLAVAEVRGTAAFAVDGWGISILLVLLGPVTAIPLLAYAGAANRLPLTSLGLLQYLTPTGIFILGIAVFGEPVTPPEWIGFAIIWVALIAFSVDTARHARRPSRADLLEVPEPT